MPEEFQLYQNYPNPFNPSTTILYDLPQQSQVTLTIYDVLGREIIRLIDEERPAGNHGISWDGKNKKGGHVAGGVYFYRIIARTKDGENFSKIKKLIIAK